MLKTKVLFVGSFISKTKDASTGGQTFASLSLINSVLNEKIDWITLDTTANTNQKRLFILRVWKALIRIIKFIIIIIFEKPKYVLLFAAHGWSFREKSFMARIAKFFNKKVVFAPRSGLIKNDLASNPNFNHVLRKTLNSVDYLICQSLPWRNFYQSYSENKNLTFPIIHNWLNTEKLFNQYGNTPKTSNNFYNVLFLGWITENKGVYDLVEAFESIRNTEIQLHLAGNGDAFEDIKQLISKQKQFDNIFLNGWVHGKDKLNLLKKADLFILPSYQEGYPNALLEAMAAGIPTIASNIETISDFIVHKQNGYLIKPGDSSGIAAGILWYKNNPAKGKIIAEKARKTILARNTLNVAVNKFSQIFDI